MTILVMCTNPQCGRMMNAPADSAGQKARCPECGTVQIIPGNPPAGRPQPHLEPDSEGVLELLVTTPSDAQPSTSQPAYTLPESILPEPILISEEEDEEEYEFSLAAQQDTSDVDEGSIDVSTAEDAPKQEQSAEVNSTFFELTNLDEELFTAAEAQRREALGTTTGVAAVFGMGLLGSGLGFAAGLVFFDQNRFLLAYVGSVIGWVAGFVLGMLSASGMDSSGDGDLPVSAPDIMLRNCLHAPRYGASCVTGILVLVVFSFGAHMLGWMLWTLTQQSISGQWSGDLRITLAVLGITAEVLFVGYAANVCIDIVRSCLEGGDKPPEVANLNPLRSLLGAVETALLVALYVLPVVTLSLLPLGIISTARGKTFGGAALRWTYKTALRRPAQLIILWLMLMLWGAILTFVCVIVIWAGKIMIPAIPDPATQPAIMIAGIGYAAMAVLISVAGAVLICAMFHCIGIFARENRDMLQNKSSRVIEER